MFPAGPVNETLATPPNVATGFPTHLEWSLYLLPVRRYGRFEIWENWQISLSVTAKMKISETW